MRNEHPDTIIKDEDTLKLYLFFKKDKRTYRISPISKNSLGKILGYNEAHVKKIINEFNRKERYEFLIIAENGGGQRLFDEFNYEEGLNVINGYISLYQEHIKEMLYLRNRLDQIYNKRRK